MLSRRELIINSWGWQDLSDVDISAGLSVLGEADKDVGPQPSTNWLEEIPVDL